jgi:hypothetical protein
MQPNQHNRKTVFKCVDDECGTVGFECVAKYPSV